jgi:hypothetical protein
MRVANVGNEPVGSPSKRGFQFWYRNRYVLVAAELTNRVGSRLWCGCRMLSSHARLCRWRTWLPQALQARNPIITMLANLRVCHDSSLPLVSLVEFP